MSVWQEKFISPNKYSRPQLKLNGVKKLVVHWTANYGATAENHYKYFNNLKDRYASAHIFVDKKEAINIIPLNEVAYHANDGSYRGVSALKPNANYLSIGVELCVEKDGTFHKDTIARAVKVFAELCKKYKLDENDIVRHYDITHKNCPAPWVKDKSEFDEFKKSVKAELSGKAGDEKKETKTETKAPSKPATTTESYKGKRLECIYAGKDGVNFYSKATWDKKYKVGVVTKGLGFPTIVDKVKVDGSYMYKVKNSKGATYYITASSEYVKVEGETAKSAPKTETKKAVKKKKKYVQLPKSSDSWRVYPLGKSPVKGNEKGFLNPKKFNGLEYEILDTPQAYVYTIKTGDFGKVNIYAHPSTGAKVVEK